MFGDKDRAEAIVDAIEAARRGGPPPESAIKDLRAGRPQAEVALKAGITQAQLSRLENGTRSLTPEIAARLGPVLGVTPGELTTAEEVSRLQRLAAKGKLDPQRLLEAILSFSDDLPDSDVSDRLIDALLAVLGSAIDTYDADQHGAAVSTKSARQGRGRNTRTSLGIRRDKPNDPRRRR